MYPHPVDNITYISECSFGFSGHCCFPPKYICLIYTKLTYVLSTYIYITFHSQGVKLLHLSAACNVAAGKTDIKCLSLTSTNVTATVVVLDVLPHILSVYVCIE